MKKVISDERILTPEEHAKELSAQTPHGGYLGLPVLYKRGKVRMPSPDEPATVVMRNRGQFAKWWRPVCMALLIHHHKMVVKVFDVDKKTGKRVAGYMIALPEEQAELAGKKAYKKATAALVDGAYKTAYVDKAKLTKAQRAEVDAWNHALNDSLQLVETRQEMLNEQLEKNV
jgi:hypothetical protein